MRNRKEHDKLMGRRFEEAIRREAYCLWKLDGCPQGCDLEHWFRAKEIIQRRIDEGLGPLPVIADVTVKDGLVSEIHSVSGNPPPNSTLPPTQTIAHTLAEHQRDPTHRFHVRGTQADGRVGVAAGERLQRVRGRAHAN